MKQLRIEKNNTETKICDEMINDKTCIFKLVGVPEDAFFIVIGDKKKLDFEQQPGRFTDEYTLKARLIAGITIIYLIMVRNEHYYLIGEKNVTKNGIFLSNIQSKADNVVRSVGKVGRGIEMVWQRHHFLVPPRLWKYYFDRFAEKRNNTGVEFYDAYDSNQYGSWLESFRNCSYIEFDEPIIVSVLVIVDEFKPKLLKRTLDSIFSQTYDDFEVCICTKTELRDYENTNKIKIKLVKKTLCRSDMANEALSLAEGDYAVCLVSGAEIEADALYEMVKTLKDNTNIDIIYSDEDILDKGFGYTCPDLKPDYSPDTLLGRNCVGDLVMIRRSILNYKSGLDHCFNWEMALRLCRQVGRDRIAHICRVLYHGESHDCTRAEIDEAKQMLSSFAADQGIDAQFKCVDQKRAWFTRNYLLGSMPKVSIIIPTRDQSKILDRCLNSIFSKTTYDDYEVLVLDNQSEEIDTTRVFEKYLSSNDNFKVVAADIDFNYSEIMNIGVKAATGDVIVLLNNDTEVIQVDWLEKLAGYAVQKGTGAVGVKLKYGDETIQHAGVFTGVGKVASHAFNGTESNKIEQFGRLTVPYDYLAVTAACMAVEKKKYEEAGGLDQKNLTVAFNDVDFCIRLFEKGYYNVLVPEIELYHHESKSRGIDIKEAKFERLMNEREYMDIHWEKYIIRDPFYNENFSKIENKMFIIERKGSING